MFYLNVRMCELAENKSRMKYFETIFTTLTHGLLLYEVYDVIILVKNERMEHCTNLFLSKRC
jgi:hypothetical protein